MSLLDTFLLCWLMTTVAIVEGIQYRLLLTYYVPVTNVQMC